MEETTRSKSRSTGRCECASGARGSKCAIAPRQCSRRASARALQTTACAAAAVVARDWRQRCTARGAAQTGATGRAPEAPPRRAPLRLRHSHSGPRVAPQSDAGHSSDGARSAARRRMSRTEWSSRTAGAGAIARRRRRAPSAQRGSSSRLHEYVNADCRFYFTKPIHANN